LKGRDLIKTEWFCLSMLFIPVILFGLFPWIVFYLI
jgi:hypothetical protein